MKKFLLLTLIFSMVLPLLALDAVVEPVLIAQSDIEADDDYASDADYASDDDYANDSDYAWTMIMQAVNRMRNRAQKL